MKILVKNFRRAERAEFDNPGIILIAGNNGAGKSSTLTAIGMTAMGDATPLDRAKGEAASLVHQGREQAEVVIEYGESVMRAVWPAAKVFKEGEPPILSGFAAGVESICDMSQAEVAQTLGRIIKAAPTFEDLKKELADNRMGENVAKGVWEKVEQAGWDEAAAQSQRTGVKLKGLWESTTGEKKYGSEKASTWKPAGWDEDRHGTLSLADAAKAMENAATALQSGLANAAVDADRLAQLKAKAEELPSIGNDIEQTEKEAAELGAQMEKAEADRRALPAAQGDSHELPCPCCGVMLMVRATATGHALEESKLHQMTDEQRKEMRLKVADLDGAIANLRPRIRATDTKLGGLRERLKSAEQAASEFEASSKKKGTADVETLTTAEQEARRDHSLVKVYTDARAVADKIAANVRLTAILGPGGLRSTVLKRQLEVFNRDHIAPLVAKTKWPAITIEQDLSCTFGNTRWRDLGESHRWIVRAVIQAALAGIEKAPFILIDRADVCDARNRSALFSMLIGAKINAVVGMTANAPNNPKQVPDLAAGPKPVGATYWIANGVSKPLKDAIAAMETKA